MAVTETQNQAEEPQFPSPTEWAFLWIVWLCCTRGKVRKEVEAGNFDGELSKLGLTRFLTDAAKQHLRQLVALQSAEKPAAELIHDFVEDSDEWTIPECPPNKYIVVGSNASFIAFSHDPEKLAALEELAGQ
jgi:hypothetical protein